MDTNSEHKSFTKIKKAILSKIYAHIGTCTELTLQLILPASTINITVRNCKEIERSYVWLAWTLLQAAEITELFITGGTGICSSCMVQAGTCVDHIHLKEDLHITAHVGISDFLGFKWLH